MESPLFNIPLAPFRLNSESFAAGKILRPDQRREIYGADNFPPPYHDQISSSYSTEAEPLNVKHTPSPEEGWGVLLFLTKQPEMD